MTLTLLTIRCRQLAGAAAIPALLILLALAAAVPAGPASAQTFRDTLEASAVRLDQRAAELELMPPPATAPIGPGPLLRVGDVDGRVYRLSQRLADLGYLPPDAIGTLFDERIDLAVRSFQLAQGLKADGVVGGATRTVLDRTPQEAALMMRQSAAGMRAFAQTAPDRVLIVNLPSQTVTLVRHGRFELTMRAVVGRPSRETPLLEDRVTHIIVNPTWTVPPTVLKQDKLPNLRRNGNPGISNATVYLDGEPVVPETVDWSTVSPGRVRIVQEPGDHNALGRFRFNLTNPLNIYLHGTNEPRLFDRDVRTVSSGCVRLEDARLMAELLLAEVDVTPARIDRYLERGEPIWLKVNALPVRFVYWTATVDALGTVRLHPDVYDMVDEMAASLAPPQTPAPAGTFPPAGPAAPALPEAAPQLYPPPAYTPAPAALPASQAAPMVSAERPL
ncbi:L,D-transpeptidase family protein [Azospirillum sp. ST 5-10]|uniref:L,D-transpeptidase family protein n=1 Tax=unclassified Azospirillum TaxID=2630922 RepID=UPI003F49D03F